MSVEYKVVYFDGLEETLPQRQALIYEGERRLGIGDFNEGYFITRMKENTPIIVTKSPADSTPIKFIPLQNIRFVAPTED